MSKNQAVLEYSVSHDKLNALELAGRLHGLRLGNKVIFSRAELDAVLERRFPTSPIPPALKRRDNRERNTGGQQERFEFAPAA